MALGNKKPESSVAGMGAPPPPPPPPYAEPGGSDGLIGSLDERLQQLQATVAALVERTSAEASDAASGGDSEVAAASRTLKMAERTAEATVAEAQEEAAKLVADAQEQHDSIVAEARTTAETEFAAQRDKVAAESAAWDKRKSEVLEAFSQLDTQLALCDERLADARKLIKNAIDNPAMVAAPSMPSVGSPLVATANGDAGSSVTAETPPEVAPAAASTETVFGNPPAPVFAGPPSDPPPPQAFYPWSGNSNSSAGAESESNEEPPEAPAPPVQRRGLFGH